ncbi:aldose epimerase family protein [Bacillus massiliglaciei]|uniref:aldose epimerase family protein n=1 Tax=Bacillus massiliglaciei TaxID=1816693 RepID=UPI0018FE3841|nr:aldose epimerase family protein [Bacillus massiliglaciei]
MEIIESLFGEHQGRKIKKYSLICKKGMEFSCIELGCTVTAIKVPDKKGKNDHIVLGFDKLDDYLTHSPYFGCIIGRVAGRIKKAQFSLDGQDYELEHNENETNLHSGKSGLHQVIWNSSIEKQKDQAIITFHYKSPDGEGGFPGSVNIEVRYIINDENEWTIFYKASSDKKTLVNLTNHSYFNLSGNPENSILDHQLQIHGEKYYELDSDFLPYEKPLPSKNTVFDFTVRKKVRDGIQSGDPQIDLAGGYDHPILLTDKKLELSDQTSGRKLTVYTDQPSVIVYTGNSLGSEPDLQNGRCYKHSGICLETQKPPAFVDNMILNPGELYIAKTKYCFSLI